MTKCESKTPEMRQISDLTAKASNNQFSLDCIVLDLEFCRYRYVIVRAKAIVTMKERESKRRDDRRER